MARIPVMHAPLAFLSSSMDSDSFFLPSGMGQCLPQPHGQRIIDELAVRLARNSHGPNSMWNEGSHTITSSARMLPLPRAVEGPPSLPSQSTSSFWQADGTFSCDWAALKSGEAFSSAVRAACTFCLSRSLGGSGALSAALLDRLRAEAKVAIGEEVARLIQSVKNSALQGACGKSGQSNNAQPDADRVEATTEQLMKHPALQAVAFLSVHERRLAVFEIWLDRWQVLSGCSQCTCGSAEAVGEDLTRIASANAIKTNAPGKCMTTKVAIETLRAQVVSLREEACTAQQEEDAIVAEAQSLSATLVEKQQQLLLATERVKVLENLLVDPIVSLLQRGQQQPMSSASAESLMSSHKESFSFIAEKCNKLANLARVLQQQQQPPKRTFIRPNCDATHAPAASREGGPALETGATSLAELGGLQTPHVSLHSPRSLQIRLSSHFASPVAPANKPTDKALDYREGGTGAMEAHVARRHEEPACHRVEELEAWRAELTPLQGRVDTMADGRNGLHPGLRGEGLSLTRGPKPRAGARTPGRGELGASSPSSGWGPSAMAEAESCKRQRRLEEAEASKRQRSHTLRVVSADLDMDAEAARHPAGCESGRDAAQDAIWVDSFLGRRAEM